MSYGVVRTDKMTGTVDAAALESVKYCTVSGGTTYVPAEIENGSVVKLDKIDANNRDVFLAVDVKKDTPLTDVVLVASVETLYDERKHNLDEFVNEAGVIARGYRLVPGNSFGLTKECFASGADAVAVGDIVELAEGHKMAIVKSATASTTTVGKVIAIEATGRYTYIVVKVA